MIFPHYGEFNSVMISEVSQWGQGVKLLLSELMNEDDAN